MATTDVPTSSTSPFARLKPKKPLDIWSTREKLCLASAVFKIGDQNWLSVSRAIKPYAEPNRPSEWFHQKNCVLQYYDMMEKLEHPKRKRGGDKSENDTPSLQIMRNMTIERSEQLKKAMMEMQQEFKRLKKEVDEIENGDWDDKLQEEWEKIEEEELLSEDNNKVQVKEEEEEMDDDKALDLELTDILSVIGECDDTVTESVDESLLTDDDSNLSQSLTSTPVISLASTPTTEVSTKSAASALLSSLLKSDVKTATGLQQLKREQEQDDQQDESNQSTSSQKTVTQDNLISGLSSAYSNWSSLTDSCSSTKDTEVVAPESIETDTVSTEIPVPEPEILIEETVIEDMGEIVTTEETVTTVDVEDAISVPVVEIGEEEVTTQSQEVTEVTVKEEQTEEESETKEPAEKLDLEEDPIKEENVKDTQEPEEITLPLRKIVESIIDVPEIAESSIKDEPLSPTSSISSRISDTGSKRSGRGKGRQKTKSSPRRNTRKSFADDASSRHSDNELMSDDEVRESDIGDNLAASMHGSSIPSESFPNSPALSMCSDTEEEKSFKQWKKSIMLVWRAAATHRFANVFLHPVTNDLAPGYTSVVLRPMDLSTIKKHIDTGIIRTTVEFQRDMMLMFTNALMYNSSDHNVFRMASVMYNDVMTHIEQYVNTQIMMQSSDAKNLRQSRRPETSDKEDDPKKRRLSVDQPEGGKTKKRKRLDETL